MDKDFEMDDVVLSVEVDDEVIEKVRTGEITHITLNLNEDNQNLVLHTVDGHLILVTEDMPTKWHGCYLYNNGEFPYAIKDTLDFLMLHDEEEHCVTKIISINTEPKTRFRFQGPGKPSIEDPKGDSCIWEIQFEVVPVPEEPRYYLMRWNPKISSFKEKDYEECLKNLEYGVFRLNWSISEWQEARRGDCFYMMRTGDDKAGIVFTGQFLSDPYPGEDWAGTNKRRMYVDMMAIPKTGIGTNPRIPISKLQEAIPTIEWSKGHSGTLLPEDVAAKIGELLEQEK